MRRCASDIGTAVAKLTVVKSEGVAEHTLEASVYRRREGFLSAKRKAQASSKRGGSTLRVRRFLSFQPALSRTDPVTRDHSNHFWLFRREGSKK